MFLYPHKELFQGEDIGTDTVPMMIGKVFMQLAVGFIIKPSVLTGVL